MDESSGRMREILYKQTRLLDSLIHSLSEPETSLDPDDVLVRDVAILMIQALGVSIHSILRLTEHVDMSIRDCFGIARSVSELAVNIAYIVASPAAVAERARQHAMQKLYRDFQRSGSLGGLQFALRGASIPSSSIPGMDAALAAFTDKRGREIRDWTDKNIDLRIQEVSRLSIVASTSLAGVSVFHLSPQFGDDSWYILWSGVLLAGFGKSWSRSICI